MSQRLTPFAFRTLTVLSLGFPVAVIALPGCGDGEPEQLTAESTGLLPETEDDNAGSGSPAPEPAIDTEPVLPAPLPSAEDATSTTQPFEEATDPNQEQAAAKPESLAQNGEGAIPVPDGSPEELLSFINELAKRQWQRGSPAESYAELGRIMTARLKAAEKMLAGNPSDQLRSFAADTKLESLRNLAALGQEGAMEQCRAYAQSLAQAADKSLAQIGKLGLFKLKVDQLAAGQLTDPSGLVDELQQLIKSEDADEAVFRAVTGAAETLAQRGLSQEAKTALNQIGEAFKDHPDESVASEARQLFQRANLASFRGKLDSVLQAVMQNEQGAVDELLGVVRPVLAEPSADALNTISQVGQILTFTGHLDGAEQIYGAIAQALQNRTEEDFVEQAKSAGYLGKLCALMADTAGTRPELAKEVADGLASDSSNRLVVTTLQTAQQLEFSGQVEPATRVYGIIAGVYGEGSGRQLDARMSAAIQSAKRRVGLLGQPFEIEGVSLGGEPFQWSDYKGKVVLVDFWATWCGPCLQELPNIRKNYDRYRDQGFEVVGVNLDEDVSAVEQFLAGQKLPWATVLSPDVDRTGFANPNAVRSGVDAIPFLVLVGRDGTVAALHVRGELLEEKLKELLTKQPPI